MKYQFLTPVEEQGKIIHPIGKIIELKTEDKQTQKWLTNFTIKPASETESETETETSSKKSK